MASIDDQLGLWVSSLAAESLDPLHNVLGSLIGHVTEHHVSPVKPEKRNKEVS